MQLVIKIDGRGLAYSYPDKSGEGLENLIKSTSQNKFDEIILIGESKSYTFLRQIALFVNLLVKTKSSGLLLQSPSFEESAGIILPLYG